MSKEQHSKLVESYEHMLEELHDLFSTVEDTVRPKLSTAIESIQQKSIEMGKLTQDEAEKVAGYLKRDIHDMGQYVNDTGKELKDWFQFDLGLIEDRMEKMFTAAADKTSVELMKLKERAAEMGVWKTGEITAPGTLVCKECGEKLHFKKTAHIPPCPKCHGSSFKRSS